VFQLLISTLVLIETRGSKQQKPLRSDALPEMPDEIDAGSIRPVQILQEQNHGKDARDFGHRIPKLSQHPLSGCAYGFTLELVERATGKQRGKLKTPGGRVAAKQNEKAFAPRAGQKSGNALEKGEISLAGSVLLDTGAAGDQQFGILSLGGVQE